MTIRQIIAVPFIVIGTYIMLIGGLIDGRMSWKDWPTEDNPGLFRRLRLSPRR